MKLPFKIFISCTITLLLFICNITVLNNLTERKESRNKYYDFFEQKQNFDVLFLGSSHTINAIYPMELWDDYGIVSYNLGGHGNRIPTTYAVLKEALLYTTPKLVVLDCFHVKSNRMYSDSIEQVHLSMDAFPLTIQKYKSLHELINDSKLEMEFLWPFVTYHNRWDSLTPEDFNPIPSVEKGAEIKVGIATPNPISSVSPDSKLTDNTTGIIYLRKIIELCQKNNINILLTYFPFPSNTEEQMEANRIYDIAQEYNINYINFLDTNNIVDYSTDCLDPGSHLNAAGGKKVSSYIGKYIISHYPIADRRQDSHYSFWNDDYMLYLQYKIHLLKIQNTLTNYLMLLEDNDFTYNITNTNDLQTISVFYNNKLVDKANFCNEQRILDK